MEGLELWGGGELRSKNIGPAAGDHRLGEFKAPGLYFLVGENAGGKSSHLDLIARMQDDKLLRGDASVTDGETSAFLELAAHRIAFRRGPGGDVKAPKRTDSGEPLPSVDQLPEPIEILISGAHLQGEDARARRRLENLLLYAPIDSTDEIVGRLVAYLAERTFATVDEEYRAEWWRLAEQAAAGNTRLKIARFLTSGEVEHEILYSPREGILDDHGLLLGVLNTQANTGAKVAAEQQAAVAGFEGRLEQAVEAAATTVGVEPSEAFRDRLIAAGSVDEAREIMEAARRAAVEVEVGHRQRFEETARRARLLDTHGTRPDKAAAAQRFSDAEAAVQTSKAEAAKFAQDAVANSALLDRLEIESGSARSEIAKAYEAWGLAAGEVNDAWVPIEEIAENSEALVAKIQASSSAGSVLASSVEQNVDLFGQLAKAREDVETAQGAHERAQAAEEDRTEERNKAWDEKAAVVLQVAAWDETQALIEADVPGPTDEDLAAANTKKEEAEAAFRVAEAGVSYRELAAEFEKEERFLEWIETVTDDFREAAKDAWVSLGQIVTSELALPWLRVDGLRIVLRYGADGQLAQADTAGEIAERDLDDEVRVSTAELHEAMLRLMLERREARGGLLIIPWQIMAALDDERLARFSGQVGSHGLFALSERPRRAGDAKELALVYVEPVK